VLAHCAAAAAAAAAAGLKRIANWNLDFMSNSDEGKAYMDLVRASSSSSSSSDYTKAVAAGSSGRQQRQ
jgi:3-deoxy-D-arabino-heptulosonate 7-phosphate (DAHP) synthase class II